MSRLDVLAAQAVFTARAFERAVHDDGPWEMAWGPFVVPATRECLDDGVHFSAVFPAHCYLVEPNPLIGLYIAGDPQPVLIRSIEFPGDQGFTVSWHLDAREAARIS